MHPFSHHRSNITTSGKCPSTLEEKNVRIYKADNIFVLVQNSFDLIDILKGFQGSPEVLGKYFENLTNAVQSSSCIT